MRNFHVEALPLCALHELHWKLEECKNNYKIQTVGRDFVFL